MSRMRTGDRPGRVTCSLCCVGGPGTGTWIPMAERDYEQMGAFIVDRETALAGEHGMKACELLGLSTVRSGLLFPYDPVDEAMAAWHHARIALAMAIACGLDSYQGFP